jgi:plasmid stabilization system protein ParE
VTYRIRYHDQVNADLQRIKEWVRGYTNEQTARQRLRLNRTSIRALSELPYRGASRNDIVPGLRILPIDDQTVVSYLIDEQGKEILILFISFAGADWISRSVERSESE